MKTHVLSRRTRMLCISCALFCLSGMAASLTYRTLVQPTASAATSWGLSYRSEGEPPVGNASSEQLAKLGARYLGDPGQPVIYLTFDAGYENGFTPAILDTLKQHEAPAVFFLVGHYIAGQPELVRRMVEEGHVVGNHTNTHPDMSRLADRAAFAKELDDLEALYTEATGQAMEKLYRPPQGKYSEANLRMAQELGYETVLWSLAYVDWYTDNQPTRQQALDKLLPRIHNGAIVLLHSTSATNAAVLDELLTAYEDMGYSFGDIRELIRPGASGS